jgi:anti-sigma factor RsiW
MTCREVSEFLMAYLSDELPAKRRSSFEEHLVGCRDCQAYLESYKATVELHKAALESDGAATDAVPEQLLQAILRARAEKK